MSNTIEPPVKPPAMMPAWIVCAWPPVSWQAASAPDLQFVHLGTRVLSLGDDSGPCAGQTLWGDDSVEHSTGVAWDWVDIGGGVVAMSDPLGIITNLRLTDAEGTELSADRIALHLHRIVYKLPWQNEVQRAVGSAPRRRRSVQPRHAVG